MGLTLIQDQVLKFRQCLSCRTDFQPRSGRHRFCSDTCKGAYKYKIGLVTTDSQYKLISNDWRRYLQRLTYAKGRTDLTVETLLGILEAQDYKCALSGVGLTCVLNKGMTHFTNASIDRIKPGGPYSEENIRLVCRIANIMKWNMLDQELLDWCERITSFAKKS